MTPTMSDRYSLGIFLGGRLRPTYLSYATPPRFHLPLGHVVKPFRIPHNCKVLDHGECGTGHTTGDSYGTPCKFPYCLQQRLRDRVDQLGVHLLWRAPSCKIVSSSCAITTSQLEFNTSSSMTTFFWCIILPLVPPSHSPLLSLQPHLPKATLLS